MGRLSDADRQELEAQCERLARPGWHEPAVLARAQAQMTPGDPPGDPLLSAGMLARYVLPTLWMRDALAAGEPERLRDLWATAARLEWLDHQEAVVVRGERRPTRVWLLFDAAAAGDRKLYDRIFALSPAPLDHGSPVCMRLHNALLSAMQDDPDAARAELRQLLARKTTRYYADLARGVEAVLDEDPARLGESVAAVAAGWRRVRDQHVPWCRKLVALHAHALLHLARWWWRDADRLAAIPRPDHDTFWPEIEAAVAAQPEPAISLGDPWNAAAPDLLRWLQDLP